MEAPADEWHKSGARLMRNFEREEHGLVPFRCVSSRREDLQVAVVRSDLERNVADTEARLKNDIRQKQPPGGRHLIDS